jgi:DNA invertase Pin-like site-specific DNA recombinase
MQDSALREWCAENSHKSLERFEDFGLSGTLSAAKRPALKRMLALAFRQRFDTIVVYRLDRLSRDAGEAIRTIMDLVDSGRTFICPGQPVVSMGPRAPSTLLIQRTVLALFAELAEIERDTICERIRRGLIAAKERGVKLGKPETMSQHKDEAVRLRAAGKTYREIAAGLSISVGSVHRLLK